MLSQKESFCACNVSIGFEKGSLNLQELFQVLVNCNILKLIYAKNLRKTKAIHSLNWLPFSFRNKISLTKFVSARV